jgi:hypothetical protein
MPLFKHCGSNGPEVPGAANATIYKLVIPASRTSSWWLSLSDSYRTKPGITLHPELMIERQARGTGLGRTGKGLRIQN